MNHLFVLSMLLLQVLAIRFHHINKVIEDRHITGCTFHFKAADVIHDRFQEIMGNPKFDQLLCSDHAFAHGISGALLCGETNKEMSKDNNDIQDELLRHGKFRMFPARLGQQNAYNRRLQLHLIPHSTVVCSVTWP